MSINNQNFNLTIGPRIVSDRAGDDASISSFDNIESLIRYSVEPSFFTAQSFGDCDLNSPLRNICHLRLAREERADEISSLSSCHRLEMSINEDEEGYEERDVNGDPIPPKAPILTTKPPLVRQNATIGMNRLSRQETELCFAVLEDSTLRLREAFRCIGDLVHAFSEKKLYDLTDSILGLGEKIRRYPVDDESHKLKAKDCTHSNAYSRYLKLEEDVAELELDFHEYQLNQFLEKLKQSFKSKNLIPENLDKNLEDYAKLKSDFSTSPLMKERVIVGAGRYSLLNTDYQVIQQRIESILHDLREGIRTKKLHKVREARFSLSELRQKRASTPTVERLLNEEDWNGLGSSPSPTHSSSPSRASPGELRFTPYS